MGKITQMRSQKASKAKYKKPKTPAQIAAADIRKAARAADDTETDFNGCPPHRHSDLEVKSAVDGKMKVDEMVGKVNQSNARQIVDELDKQLGEMDLESPEESQHRSFMKEALSMVGHFILLTRCVHLTLYCTESVRLFSTWIGIENRILEMWTDMV